MRPSPLIISLLIMSSLIALTGCTQQPAQVAMRGTEYFGKDAGRFGTPTTIQAAAPVAQVAAAPVENVVSSGSIGVSDLAPAAGSPEVKKSEVQKPKENVLAVNSAYEPSAPLPANAWTNKPRDENSFASAAAGDEQSKYIWPVASHDVTASFGGSKGKSNDGINIAAPEGEPVWAAADGEVVYADSKMKGYGKMVLVKHAGGKTTTYAYLSRIGVEKYDRVKQGDIIGYVGTTGSAKTPQLYFSMREGTQAVDPQKYLDRKVAGL